MFIVENFRTGETRTVSTLANARAIQEAWWASSNTCLSGWTGIWHNGELV